MSDHQPRNASPTETPGPEPWLRGTLTDVPAVGRAVLHALELAREDLHKWCGQLSDKELTANPQKLPSVAFQLRHIVHSMDRLLTYAEGHRLAEGQLAELKNEMNPGGTRDELFTELTAALDRSAQRIRALAVIDLEAARTVGGKALPSTVGGLLVHVADHTQRHVGQAVTTAKILLAQR